MPHPRKIRPALFRPTARRLRVESLEDRLAPAIFTGAGPDMAIELNNPNEVATLSTNGTTVTVTLNNGTANTAATGGHVTGNGTATATFASATYNGTIFIADTAAGTAVAFANSTGPTCPSSTSPSTTRRPGTSPSPAPRRSPRRSPPSPRPGSSPRTPARP